MVKMTAEKSSNVVSDGPAPKKHPTKGVFKSRIDYIPMDKEQGFSPRQYQVNLSLFIASEVTDFVPDNAI